MRVLASFISVFLAEIETYERNVLTKSSPWTLPTLFKNYIKKKELIDGKIVYQ